MATGEDAQLLGVRIHGDLRLLHGGQRQVAQRRLGAIDDLVPRRPRVEGDVIPRAQLVLLVTQPQHAFALEDEDALVVREMEMEGKRLLSRLQLEPAHPEPLPASCRPQPFAAEREAALLHDLIVALQQRSPAHAFFPSCTRGFCPRGTAVMLASATRSATFCAMRISACASGRPGSAATTGRPSSLPARMAVLIGTRPRKGTPSLAAACSAPPLEKMSVS